MLSVAVRRLSPSAASDAGVPVRLEGHLRYGAWAWLFPEDRLPRLEREAIEVPDGDGSAYF